VKRVDRAGSPPALPPALAGLPDPQRARLHRAPEDRSLLVDRPMLATLTDRRSFDDRWIFERKLDGVRALAVRDGDRAWLLSRTGRVMDATYPELVGALAGQERPDFVVDGEIVALRDGRTDFSLLQQRMGLTDPRAVRASRARCPRGCRPSWASTQQIHRAWDLLRAVPGCASPGLRACC